MDDRFWSRKLFHEEHLKKNGMSPFFTRLSHQKAWLRFGIPSLELTSPHSFIIWGRTSLLKFGGGVTTIFLRFSARHKETGVPRVLFASDRRPGERITNIFENFFWGHHPCGGGGGSWETPAWVCGWFWAQTPRGLKKKPRHNSVCPV